MDTDWIKAAAAQVRTTIRQAINKVDRISKSNADGLPMQASDDAPDTRTEAAPQPAGDIRQPLGTERNSTQEQTP